MPQVLELFVNGIAVGCIYSLIGLGFTMIIRSTGILNFAQGEMVMLGAMFGLSAVAFCSIAVSGCSRHRNAWRGRRFGLH
jgi:branched-subunit amino acid ABC-type transport system permease component